MVNIEDQINSLLEDLEEKDEEVHLYISDSANQWTHKNRNTDGGEAANRLIDAIKDGIARGTIQNAEITTTDEVTQRKINDREVQKDD